MSDFQTPGKRKISVWANGHVVTPQGGPHFYPFGTITVPAFDRAISRKELAALYLQIGKPTFYWFPYPCSSPIHSRN